VTLNKGFYLGSTEEQQLSALLHRDETPASDFFLVFGVLFFAAFCLLLFSLSAGAALSGSAAAGGAFF
jgi:hypothetical protein